MRSFNVDDKLKDREIIKRAIVVVCKSKKKKKKGSNRKYKIAQHILKNQDKYIDETLEMILAFEKAMKNPEHIKKMEEMGLEVKFLKGQDYIKLLKADEDGVRSVFDLLGWDKK